MKEYSASECEILFDQKPTEQAELRRGVTLTRTKTTTAGPIRYVEIYPVWSTASIIETAKREKARASREAQVKLNQRISMKRLEQLANANFGEGDLFVTLTYRDYNQPENGERAVKDIRNFILRIRRRREKRGLPELKYIYTLEETTSAAHGTRYHAHMMLSGDGMDRDEVEQLWRKGLSNTRRIRWQEAAVSGLAVYFSKHKETQTKRRRKWNASRNLREPVSTQADHKISPRKSQRICAAVREEGRRIIEAAYPGWRLIDEVTVRTSEYVPGGYIYAKLRKKE
jgi:hypothetical protein